MKIRRWSERRGKGGATDIEFECCRLTGGKEGRRRRRDGVHAPNG